MPKLHIEPQNLDIVVSPGTNLLSALRDAHVFLDAPCGGSGKCGKCKVRIGGREALACQISVDSDITVTVPSGLEPNALQAGIHARQRIDPHKEGDLLAFDIGTTTVVCYLLDGKTGAEKAKSSMLNPQTAFGADVISRIRAALEGELERQTKAIRDAMTGLIIQVCGSAQTAPEQIGVVSVVGNPAMQQLFLGISPENLAAVPFHPALTEAAVVPCREILPICSHADLLIVPDISGYIGADTLGCVLATELYRQKEITLLVDIGTNGEMVLGNRDRMIACSTAAGPALEGANIQCGMRGTAGAIDHVWQEDGQLRYSVIGGGTPVGICGSGLIDAIAVSLNTGLLNKRGRIQNGERIIRIADSVILTQNDIRQVQLAKGAIYAGIVLMAKQLGLAAADIQKVQLAGAFGNYLDPQNACRIGLLPEELLDRMEPVGNTAGSGAKMLACDGKLLPLTQKLAERIEFLELGSLPEFARTFAKAMNFREEDR